MKSTGKKIFFNDYAFYVSNDVYEPAEDTLLLAENLSVDENDVVLDMGTGCGILGILAAKKAEKVVATDLNPHAIDCTKMNAKLNKVADKMDIRLGDLFQPVKQNEHFSLILFNAPYLPSNPDEDKTWIGRAWAGGPMGRQLIDRFISEAPQYLNKNGRILLVQSSLSNVNETLQKLRETGLKARILAEKKVMFETIVLIEARR
ncbi:MAG: class I SAM-dependent methyltransferase [Candidatus Bathyarchaeota archaeon]|nr:class I SAM-dependent methyltransferase [Candidatus Bathyarchaeota archaeon]